MRNILILLAILWSVAANAQLGAGSVGGGSPPAFPGCSESGTYLAAQTGLSLPQQHTFDTAICTLVGDGLGTYAALDTLYFMANVNAANYKVNVISPGTRNLTETGTCTLTSSPPAGVTGDGTTCFENMNYNPATSGGNMTLNSATVFACMTNSRTTNASPVQIGLNDGTNYTYVEELAASTDINGATSFPVVSWGANVQGFALLTRVSSGSIVAYKNGTSLGTLTSTSGALPNANIYAIGWNNNGSAANFAPDTFAVIGSGGAMSSAQQASLRGIMNTMMISLGNSNPAAC